MSEIKQENNNLATKSDSQRVRQLGDIELQYFDSEKHLPMIEYWLHQPHVQRWWGEPATTMAQLQQRPTGADQAIITVAGEPVGYLCWQRYSDDDREILGLPDLPAGAIDIDIMIGEVSHIGRGVGPSALRLLLARLGRDVTVPLVGMCTAVDNTSAVRAYAKVGFSVVREFDDPECGRCLFLVADPRHAAV